MDDYLRSLVGLLIGEEPAPLAEVLDRETSVALVGYVRRQRLVPLLVHGVAGGTIRLDHDVADELWGGLPKLLNTAVLIEEGAAEAIDVLERGGVEVRVMKGLAACHLDYPDPSLRQYSDADLLVRPRDMDRAIELLAMAGILRSNAIRGGRWAVQHAIAVEVAGVEIDLHHRLLHGAAGHLAGRLDLFDAPVAFSIGGRTVNGLPAHLRLLQAAAQNVITPESDRKQSSDVDTVLLWEWAGPAQAAAESVALSWLLPLAWRRTRAIADLHPVSVGEPSVLERIVSAPYRTRAGGPRDDWHDYGTLLAEFLVAPARNKFTLARSFVAPGEEFLEGRERTLAGQFKHQARRLAEATVLRRVGQ